MFLLSLTSKNNLVSFKLSGESLTTVKAGNFNFENLIIYGFFDETYLLVMSPKIIKKSPSFNDFYFKNEIILNQSYYYYFPVTVSDCFYGQIMLKLENSDIFYCQNCPSGTYSIYPNEPCLACVVGANCSEGILNVYPGFWRIKGRVYSCPLDFACV